MMFDDPVTLDDGSILVVVRDDEGNEIGFNQTFPTEES
jgi:hypothetical protein